MYPGPGPMYEGDSTLAGQAYDSTRNILHACEIQ